MTRPEVEAEGRAVTQRVLDLVLREGAPLLIVNSPPGAGKTRLVASLGSVALGRGALRGPVVAPRNGQVYEVARRVKDAAGVPVQILHSDDSPPPADLATHPNVLTTTDPVSLAARPGVVVATVAKTRMSAERLGDRSFDLLIVDEAYQVSFNAILPVIGLASQLVLVGDPGQLPPIVVSDTSRLETAANPVHLPVPRYLRRQYPDAPEVSLPLTFRLPQDTVDLVQPSLYPDLPFRSAVEPGDRSLVLNAGGMGSPIDQTLDAVADGRTIVGLSLPARAFGPDEVDEEIADLASAVAARLLERIPEWAGQRELVPDDIGIADPHVASGTSTHRRLRARGIEGIDVTTPEVWQGRQRPIMIVKHPLSGARTLGEFGLDPGRLTVMLSRHQLACIVVTRRGLPEALQMYEHDSGARPTGSDNPIWRGWLAHVRLVDDLSGRVFKAA